MFPENPVTHRRKTYTPLRQRFRNRWWYILVQYVFVARWIKFILG